MRAPKGGGWGGGRERERERELESAWLLLLYVFFPLDPALCKLGSARSAVLPEVFTQVLRHFFDFPLFYFYGVSLPCLLAIAILDSFSLF